MNRFLNLDTILLMLIMISSARGYGQSKSVTGIDFSCSCPTIDLTIYNGLDGATGGQMIMDNDEFETGAVTLANLNDTDNDTVIDKDDSSVVFTPPSPTDPPPASPFTGRNEVDLMKLEITSNNSGTLPTDCSQSFTLEITSGNIKFWTLPTKGSLITDLTFNISSLPMTIYIEALEYSETIRDIHITAKYGNVIQDEVKATAIWAEVVKNNDVTHVFKERGNTDYTTYVPDGLPINPDEYVHIQIDHFQTDVETLVGNKKAGDNSRYGFGPFPEGFNQSECSFGGRILFEFKVYPTNTELNSLGVFFDIGRRRESLVFNYNTAQDEPTENENEPWPEQIEDCNDDYTNGLLQNFDEEITLSENSPNFFSYDTPSSPLVLCDAAQAVNFKSYHSDFIEFVRIGINNDGINPYDNDTDQVIGSRASNFIPWNIDFNLKRVVKEGIVDDPYNQLNHVMGPNTEQVSASFPVSSVSNTGNGEVKIDLNPMANTEVYALVAGETVTNWFLYSNQSATMPIADSNSSSSGPWTINLPNQMQLTITDGTIPFIPYATLYFTVYNAQMVPLNSLN